MSQSHFTPGLHHATEEDLIDAVPAKGDEIRRSTVDSPNNYSRIKEKIEKQNREIVQKI